MIFGMPVLALGAGEIFALVMAALTIIGGILGHLNEEKKTKERKAAARREQRPGPAEQVTEVDSLARRRREQLEAMARRRRGEGSSPRPDNLTTTQAVDREAAKAAYAERAASMREPGELNTMLTRGEAGGQAQAGADAERAAALARRSAQREEQVRRRAEQRAEGAQHRAERERRAQRRLRGKQQQPAQEVEPVPPVEAEEESGPRRTMAQIEQAAVEADMVHGDAYAPHAAAPVAAAAESARSPAGSRLSALMAGRSWRDLFLLKEVLDPPLAMRPSQQPGDPFER